MTENKPPRKTGYKSPPVEHQIKKGQVLNPGGKTKEQKAREMKNAEMAAEIKEKILERLRERDADAILEEMSGADLVRLLRDAEDRAHGTPRQSVDHTSSDGTMTPHRVEIVAVNPDDNGAD